jgi:hypothetical protein
MEIDKVALGLWSQLKLGAEVDVNEQEVTKADDIKWLLRKVWSGLRAKARFGRGTIVCLKRAERKLV